jgi:hypothetical protein
MTNFRDIVDMQISLFLLNHLIRAHQQRLRDGDAECLRCLQN